MWADCGVIVLVVPKTSGLTPVVVAVAGSWVRDEARSGRCALAKASETGEANGNLRRTASNLWTLVMQTVRSSSKLPSFPNSWVDTLTFNATESLLQLKVCLFDQWLLRASNDPCSVGQRHR
jgi:hypothetical protein